MYSTLIAQNSFFKNFHYVEEIRKSLRTRNKWIDYSSEIKASTLNSIYQYVTKCFSVGTKESISCFRSSLSLSLSLSHPFSPSVSQILSLSLSLSLSLLQAKLNNTSSEDQSSSATGESADEGTINKDMLDEPVVMWHCSLTEGLFCPITFLSPSTSIPEYLFFCYFVEKIFFDRNCLGFVVLFFCGLYGS